LNRGDVTVSEGPLRAAMAAIYRAAGCDPETAGRIGDHLVEANLAGHDSHGVGMTPEYLRALREGKMRPAARPEVVLDRGHLVALDGRRGPGQVAGREAMALAVERAGRHGSAIVHLRNSHHLGRIGAWAEQCLEAGYVSLHCVNVIGHGPLVAPFGGSDVRLGTNPFCVGIPSPDGRPIVLDMATSRIAMGKVRVAKHAGRRLAPGTLIDAAGRPTDDPGVMVPEVKGALLPFGDYKGYGLALVCDILAGALTGGGTNHPESHAPDVIINNMLSIVIDPGALGAGGAMAAEVARVLAWVRASPPAPGSEGVMVPGDPERRAREARRRDGVPIPAATWEDLRRAAATVGIDLDAAAGRA
jgi:uncharacterized oxidoreductase